MVGDLGLDQGAKNLKDREWGRDNQSEALKGRKRTARSDTQVAKGEAQVALKNKTRKA